MPVLTVKRNDYRRNPKSSTVYTPRGLAQFLFNLLDRGRFQTVLDPAIGTGRLTDSWYDAGCRVLGIDIVDHKPRCHQFILGRYEDITGIESPDLVVCNSPFNGCDGKHLYPEIFLAHTFKLFGVRQPVVLFAPMGLRLNQRKHSARWRWLRENKARITSIIDLPLDIFPGVEFHAEILIFNIDGLQPHYFLPDEALQ